MLILAVFIVKQIDVFVKAEPLNKEMHFAGIWFKKEDEEFESHKTLHRVIGDNSIAPCFQLIYKADRQAAKQRILERWFFEQILKATIKMQAHKRCELNIQSYLFLFL